jgi:hypothetical protein
VEFRARNIQRVFHGAGKIPDGIQAEESRTTLVRMDDPKDGIDRLAGWRYAIGAQMRWRPAQRLQGFVDEAGPDVMMFVYSGAHWFYGSMKPGMVASWSAEISGALVGRCRESLFSGLQRCMLSPSNAFLQ